MKRNFLIFTIAITLIFFLKNPSFTIAHPGCKPRLHRVCPSGYPYLCGNYMDCCTTIEECGSYGGGGIKTVQPSCDICGCDVSIEFPDKTTVCPNCNKECWKCLADPDRGMWTALGCIPTKDTTQFVAWLLKFAIGIGGGIAFLLMIFGGFKIITSAGNPERVKAGQEMITSALTGLIFIIFSLFLLQLIGVKILQIPGFGTP